jgi:hypothetical protein
VRKLLERDFAFLDGIQAEMASARQFLFAVRLRREKEEQVFHLLNRVEKTAAEHGFQAHRMPEPELKRMLALYFGINGSVPQAFGEQEPLDAKQYFDRIAPGVLRFFVDHNICGNFYKSVWAVTEYPPTTEVTAILAHLADRSGVTLRIYNRPVSGMEQRKIVQQAMRKNHMMASATDVHENIRAQENIEDVAALLTELRRNKEPLLHTAVFIELKASTEDGLRELQSDVQMELTHSKISVDRLLLRQKEGFLSVLPCGHNLFGVQFERILPASAVANLFPLNYSGKTDEKGLYLGRDKYGTNVLVDFDRRTDDKTNSNILILGNSGQGKSYLMKLLLCNLRESGNWR